MSAPAATYTKTLPAFQEQPCVPCDIPAFCRNSYYRGKLLTERDFSDEQRYSIDKMRLHMRALHGWGVICGLVVQPHPHCPALRVVVGEGLAIDGCGREIRLLKEDFIELPQPVTTRPQTAPNQNGSADPSAGSRVEQSHASADDDDTPASDSGGSGAAAPTDLYLCIRYVECETEFAPAPFDDCSCTTSSQKANRVCEGYKLEWHVQPPPFWEQARREAWELDDCGQYYREGREHCPDTNRFQCMPLAVIHNFVPGDKVTVEQIDNWGPRRQLASTETLDQIIRCILTRLPIEELTRIEDTNWEHSRRMMCREFMEEYVGTEEHPRGFRVEFSEKVYSQTIDDRSFQALVVFRPDNPSEPRRMQIASARVETEPDETNWARLYINHAYAQRHLDGQNFDLFLILKCDVIRDCRGHAVDGNFIGHRFPTGDKIQGGTFESWVRIRTRPRTTEGRTTTGRMQ